MVQIFFGQILFEPEQIRKYSGFFFANSLIKVVDFIIRKSILQYGKMKNNWLFPVWYMWLGIFVEKQFENITGLNIYYGAYLLIKYQFFSRWVDPFYFKIMINKISRCIYIGNGYA